MSVSITAKSLGATLELIRNSLRAGKSLDEAITDAMEMIENYSSRGGELRVEPLGEDTRK